MSKTASQFEADNPGSLERIEEFYNAVFARVWSDADALYRKQYEEKNEKPFEGELSERKLEFFLKTQQGLFDEVYEQAFDDVFNETFDEVEDQELIEFMKSIEDAQTGFQQFEYRLLAMRNELFLLMSEDGQLMFIPPDAETLALFKQLLQDLIDLSTEIFGEHVFDELTGGRDLDDFLQGQLDILEAHYAGGQDVSAVTTTDTTFDFTTIDADSSALAATDDAEPLMDQSEQTDSSSAVLL